MLRWMDVSAFFRHARRVTERVYGHDWVAADCYVEGKASRADGDPAKGKIDQARRGFVSLPDGRTVYRYCLTCRTELFVPN